MPLKLHPSLNFSCLAAILLAAWWAYAPGLQGGFLFDDFANLPALGSTGPVDNWQTFWRYVTSGTADPLGRPLTLLTFLVDARNWPANPLPFKRTNLILHLLNALLLNWWLKRLGRTAFPNADCNRVDQAALLGSAFWLLHPLFVSTTLYVVQREAMLPATFTMLGLQAWLYGRRAILQGHTCRGLAWLIAGLGGCTLLGLLCKANGALLPAFALVIEYALLRPSSGTTTDQGACFRAYRMALFMLAWLPATAIGLYLLNQGWRGFDQGIVSGRPWTANQRLLTEPRILMDYLALLWLPRPFTPGLFNDDIPTSVSLWSPLTTLPALIAVFGLVIAAWRHRQRHPALAATVLFYFVGQSIESSTIPLELYFEHRNYLPAMMMFWPLALWLCNVRATMAGTASAAPSHAANARDAAHSSRSTKYAGRKARLALAGVLLLGIGFMTHARADLWGNQHDQALLWAALNPDSPRAQVNAATAERMAGHPLRAAARLKQSLAEHPDQLQLALNLLDTECQLGRISRATFASSVESLRTTKDTGTLMARWFEETVGRLSKPPCPQLTPSNIAELLNAAESNAHLQANPGRMQDIYHSKGRLALFQGDAAAALDDFNRALDIQVRVPVALEQAALLGAAGYPRQGLAHLDHFDAERQKADSKEWGMPWIHSWVLQEQHYWPDEMDHLRQVLIANAGAQASHTK